MTSLFDPIQIGAIHASNRIFMAPLTRARSNKDAVPTDLMVEYYEQRASAGLIISEAVGISREGLGWPYATGIWNDAQVKGWKRVTDAVHARGGKIVCQLWHMGRMCHSDVIGMQPVSSSPIAAPVKHIHAYSGKMAPEIPRELSIPDIKRIVEEYGKAAQNAIDAGFDGVQIHGANGYLIDEFLKSSSNKRTDIYGGSIENRTRFLREVTEKIVNTIGKDRTSIRLSPNGDTQGCSDSDPEPLMVLAAKILNDLGIAFVELREIGPNGTFGSSDQPLLHGPIRKAFHGPLFLNQDYTREAAIETVANGTADGVAFGRPFISNPDLVYRLKENIPLQKDNMRTWYARGAEGYTDYAYASGPHL